MHLEAETCEQIYIRQSSNISITKRVFEISHVTLKELERVLRKTFRRKREGVPGIQKRVQEELPSLYMN